MIAEMKDANNCEGHGVFAHNLNNYSNVNANLIKMQCFAKDCINI